MGVGLLQNWKFATSTALPNRYEGLGRQNYLKKATNKKVGLFEKYNTLIAKLRR